MMVRLYRRRGKATSGIYIREVHAPEEVRPTKLSEAQLKFAEFELPPRHFYDMANGWMIAVNITPAQAKVLLPFMKEVPCET